MDDIGKAAAVVADMRKIIRQDPRIIQKLHRRVFIDKLTREQASLCSSPDLTKLLSVQGAPALYVLTRGLVGIDASCNTAMLCPTENTCC